MLFTVCSMYLIAAIEIIIVMFCTGYFPIGTNLQFWPCGLLGKYLITLEKSQLKSLSMTMSIEY